MRSRITKFGASLAALVALAVGGSAIASGGQSSPAKPRAVHARAVAKTAHAARPATARVRSEANPASETAGESAGESTDASGDTDGAKQASACAAAGITSDNVQYDDATGTCTVDTGADNGNN